MGKRNQRNVSFKEVWRKAIEKYSPKKSMKLNEVSFRFQQRVEEFKQVHDKTYNNETQETKGTTEQMNQTFRQDEKEKIKFVSMIDQKPIQPSYLELIPLKNFAKKEQEA